MEENKDNQLDVKSIGYTIEGLSQEAKNVYEKLVNQEKLINYQKLNFRGSNNIDYDFSNFIPLKELFRRIYYGEILVPGAEKEIDMFNDMTEIQKNYKSRGSDYKKMKDALVINAQNFHDGREMIIEAFKSKLFPFYSGNYYHDLEEEEIPKSDNEESEKDKASVSKLQKLAIDSDKILDPKLVDKYFHSNSLKEIVEQLKDLRRQNKTSVEYNNKMALLIAGLIRLENVIKHVGG